MDVGSRVVHAWQTDPDVWVITHRFGNTAACTRLHDGEQSVFDTSDLHPAPKE